MTSYIGVLLIVLVTQAHGFLIFKEKKITHYGHIQSAQFMGHTEYQIGTHTHFPLSHLKFPINASGITGQYYIEKPKAWHMVIEASFLGKKNAGIFEDFDYIDENNPTTLSHYATGDTTLNNAFHARLAWQKVIRIIETTPQWVHTWLFGLGYRYQHIDMSVFNTRQQKLNTSGTVTRESRESKVGLIYHLDYHMPHASIAYRLNAPWVSATVSWAHAPWVWTNDYDDHVFRNKRSTADASGTGSLKMIDIAIPIARFKHTALVFSHYALEAETSGKQKQFYYGYDSNSGTSSGTNFTVDYKLKLAINETRIGLKVLF